MSKGAGKAGGVATANGGRTAVRTAGGIKFQKSQRAINQGSVAVKVSVAKLEAAWKKDTGYHIPKGGGSDKQKYANAKAFVGKKGRGKSGPVRMPEVTYSGKSASITDGRHRMAAIRDSGKKSVWVTVPRGQAKAVKRDLGA